MKPLTRGTYYSETSFLNFSSLRTFTLCPNLYKEQYLDKTYKEPEHDYFVYGLLVDCLLTEPEKLEEKFIKVSTTTDPHDALRLEKKIEELEGEIEKMELYRKAQEGNKTAMKGLDKRTAEIEDIRVRLTAIKEIGTRTQVTFSMWQNAQETAEVIRQNPFFRSLHWDEGTSQQIFCSDRLKRKGRLDYVDFSAPAQTIYNLWITKLIDDTEFRKQMDALPPQDKHGRIIDVKSTYQLKKGDPAQYAGQLAFYQDLVEDVTGIRCDCYIIAGDKDPDRKMAQDFIFHPDLLEVARQRNLAAEVAFRRCHADKNFPAAKMFRGQDQECFRCSVCSIRPFSIDAPLLVTASRF